MITKSLFFLPDQIYVSLQYFYIYRRRINFNDPQTYSEKLNVLKLRKQPQNKILCSDKVTAKEFLKSKGYEQHLIPTIDVATSFHKIRWNEYPTPYIVKVSNGSSQSMIVIDKPVRFISILRFYFASSVRHYVYGREWVYKHSKKQFIVEPFLQNGNEVLNDYKFHCFNGNPMFITINDNNLPNHARMMIDSNYQYYPYPFASGAETKVTIPPAHLLDEMKDIAKNLSAEHDFLRLDFYIVDDKVKIGEFTFYPMKGYVLRNSHTLDALWGSYLSI